MIRGHSQSPILELFPSPSLPSSYSSKPVLESRAGRRRPAYDLPLILHKTPPTHSRQTKIMATDPRDYATTDHRQPPPSDTQSSSTSASSSRFPDRYHPPSRSSTVPTPDDHPGARSSRKDDYYSVHSRSEDLNHSTTSSKASDKSPFLPSTSAPSLSSSTRLANTTSNSVASTNSQRRNSTSSYRSVASDTSDPTSGGQLPSTAHTASSSVPSSVS